MDLADIRTSHLDSDLSYEWLRLAVLTLLDEVDRLETQGTPGVMHEVDKAFYNLTVQQRNAAWVRGENTEAALKNAQRMHREQADRANDLQAQLNSAKEELQELRKLVRFADQMRERFIKMDDKANDFGRTWEMMAYDDTRATVDIPEEEANVKSS